MNIGIRHVPFLGVFVTFTRHGSALSKYLKLAGSLEASQAAREYHNSSDEFWTAIRVTLLFVVPLSFLFDKLF